MKTYLQSLLLTCLYLLAASAPNGRVITGKIKLQRASINIASPSTLPHTPRRQITKSLILNNGLDWGVWGPVEYCPDESFAASAEAKFEPYGVLDTDETALNAVKLYCVDANFLPTGYVTSTEGEKGDWQGMQNCNTGYITGMRGKVLGEQGIIGDDVAVQNLQLECDFGIQTLTLVENEKKRVVNIPIPNGQEEEAIKSIAMGKKVPKIASGDWGLWSSCPNDSAVCGVETRLEEPALIVDDTGVNDVSLFCCALDPSKKAQEEVKAEEEVVIAEEKAVEEETVVEEVGEETVEEEVGKETVEEEVGEEAKVEEAKVEEAGKETVEEEVEKKSKHEKKEVARKEEEENEEEEKMKKTIKKEKKRGEEEEESDDDSDSDDDD